MSQFRKQPYYDPSIKASVKCLNVFFFFLPHFQDKQKLNNNNNNKDKYGFIFTIGKV